MRRANGEGSIIKLGGKRRRPYAARVTVGYTPEGKQKFKYIGYYAKKSEAKIALRKYLVNPYDILKQNTTLIDIFEEWIKTSTLSEATLNSYRSAFKQASKIHKMNMRDIKARHLEFIIESMTPAMGAIFKNAMSNVYNYCLKHEIVDKNISELVSAKTIIETKTKNPFTIDEINQMRSYKNPLNDTTLILLYTGMRISELLEMKTENVHLEERYMIGGRKTKAGLNRIIPIHNEIYDIVKRRYEKGHKYLITINNKALTYKTYRHYYWDRIKEDLKLSHRPHDTRHTFATFADKCNMNKVAVKKIIGHAINDITDHYTHKNIDELLIEINKLKYE